MAQSDIQRAYRLRQAERNLRMRSALETIAAELATNEKPLGVKLLAIAQEGLK